METISHTTENANLSGPRTKQTFGTAKRLIAVYGGLGAAVLLTVVILALTGHTVSSFLWGRSAGVFASAVVAYWLTVLASRGARWAYLRVRIISIVVPIAIVAVDLIPGVCPAWFTALQATCAVALAATAFIINGPTLRAANTR